MGWWKELNDEVLRMRGVAQALCLPAGIRTRGRGADNRHRKWHKFCGKRKERATRERERSARTSNVRMERERERERERRALPIVHSLPIPDGGG